MRADTPPAPPASPTYREDTIFMSDKWILIVDDEESILTVLKSSLKRLGQEYRVVTVTNGQAALEQIKQRSFDLVVTDYKMAGLDGLRLLEQIRLERPDTRVILMTAYGSSSVEAEASRLKAYRYIAKPLEINAFREIVKEAVAQNRPGFSGIFVLSENDYREVVQILRKLQADVGARYIFLTDNEGRYIAFTGIDDNVNFRKIAALLGGSIATLIEAGRTIDNDEEAINLGYREAKKGNLYVINIGRQFLLIIVIDRGPSSSRLGTVWYCAQATVMTLRGKFEHAEYTSAENLLGENLEQAIAVGLQDVFFEASSNHLPRKLEEPAPLSPVSSTGIFDPSQGEKNVWPVPPRALSLQNNNPTDIVHTQRVNEFSLTDSKGKIDNDQSQPE